MFRHAASGTQLLDSDNAYILLVASTMRRQIYKQQIKTTNNITPHKIKKHTKSTSRKEYNADAPFLYYRRL